MESKGTFMILIIVVAVLALSLAALAGYLFIVQGSSANEGTVLNANGESTKDIPDKEERISIDLFEDTKIYNLQSDDPNKASLIQVHVSLDCYKQLKGDKKAVVTDKVMAYEKEIQELIVRFFLTKTIDDVKNVDAMDKAKEELTSQINALLNETSKKPEDIVFRVIFSEWLFQ